MPDVPQPVVVTFLFTDIEGSTRLWEQEPEQMRIALAMHDRVARQVVDVHHGFVVKMTGDGIHAAFADPLDAVKATLELQRGIADTHRSHGVALRVRCGLHAGAGELRDNDYFGSEVNRSARIMAAAHGGQILLSQTVAALVAERLPPGVTLRDLGRVRLRDLTSPERVFQALHPDLRDEFPPLRSLEATPNNLPQQVTSFIGRKRELAETMRLLGTTRLLTLLGTGGLGKSRLSLQVAAEVLDDFPDGAWLVELAPIADERSVPQAVATVLGVREEAGRPVLEALAKHVRDRQLLIILDNCEHLIGACAQLAKTLLQSAAQVRILATSREPLRIGGETTLQIPSLSIPAANPPLSGLQDYDSVRLFIDRATAAQPDFRIGTDNAAALAEICRRLDGIPLAIELAAARVRVLSLDRIAARLDDRFKLLTGGDRTALKRQQTLRALIDWSHDLLTEPERILFRRLAAFAGGWTVEAAEAVGGGGDIVEADVLDLLTQLTEKSLVAREAEGVRYRFLETIREYADEQLRRAGEDEWIRRRHVVHYLALAELAWPELIGPNQVVWLSRLDAERENLFAAHRWCDHSAELADPGMQLAFALKRYWFTRGMLESGYRSTLEALARPAALAPTLLRCRTLHAAGQIASYLGRYAEARRYLDESLAIARSLGDKARIASALQPLGLASMGLGDHAAARQYLQEALALARELGDTRELAGVLNALAQVARVEGDLETAEPLYRQVLALARDMRDRESIAVSLLNLAMVAVGQGAGNRASEMLLEVIAIVEEVGWKPAGQSVLEVSAGLAAANADWTRAARYFGAAEAQSATTGIHRDPTDEAFLSAQMARARAALDATAFAAAEAAGGELDYDTAIADARAWLQSLA